MPLKNKLSRNLQNISKILMTQVFVGQLVKQSIVFFLSFTFVCFFFFAFSFAHYSSLHSQKLVGYSMPQFSPFLVSMKVVAFVIMMACMCGSHCVVSTCASTCRFARVQNSSISLYAELSKSVDTE